MNDDQRAEVCDHLRRIIAWEVEAPIKEAPKHVAETLLAGLLRHYLRPVRDVSGLDLDDRSNTAERGDRDDDLGGPANLYAESCAEPSMAKGKPGRNEK